MHSSQRNERLTHYQQMTLGSAQSHIRALWRVNEAGAGGAHTGEQDYIPLGTLKGIDCTVSSYTKSLSWRSMR